ncbi:MAG: DNA gyrase subunit A [Peptostreptococcaceae bacterium]
MARRKRTPTIAPSINIVDIGLLMKESFLEYSLSIMSRGLPNVYDGMIPVQRRILYALYTMNRGLKKNARVVGEVLGKYHPHGDSSVSMALARMGKDFRMNIPLIETQGNYGSIDGDKEGSMRYIECDLSEFSRDILFGPEMDVIEMVPNYDDKLKEPSVLPAKIPLCLINGAKGIVNGYACDIPPHNIGEIIDLITFYINKKMSKKAIMPDEICKYVKGPDYPTGGIIYDPNGKMLQGITSGSSGYWLASKIELEDAPRGRKNIVITEVPYDTKLDVMIESIAEMVKNGKIIGISDLTNETDRNGIRVVITVGKRGLDFYANGVSDVISILANSGKLANKMKYSCTVLVDTKPFKYGLLDIIESWLRFRLETLDKYFDHHMSNLEKEKHLIDGMTIFYANYEAINTMIFKASDEGKLIEQMMKKYKLDRVQVNQILNNRARRNLQRGASYKNRLKEIEAELKIYAGYKKHPYRYIQNELTEIKTKYGYKRKTKVINAPMLNVKTGFSVRSVRAK